MAIRNEATAPTQVDGAARSSTRPQSIDSLERDYGAWIDQATKVRDKALRLAAERATNNDRVAPTVAACDYLAETEKLFELTRGLLEGRPPAPAPGKSNGSA